MHVKDHIIASIIFSAFLFPIFKWYTIIIFLSAVLIDGDHYLWYIIVKKRWSLKKAYYHRRDGNFHDLLDIAHTIEFWILILILAIFSKFFFLVLVGITFHFILDFVYVRFIDQTKSDFRTFSIITWIYRRKSKKNYPYTNG